MSVTTAELESKLWRAADILRGQIDSSDYKNHIFSMLFLERLSDRFDEDTGNSVAAGVDKETAENDPDEHEFFLPKGCRWADLTAAQMELGETLNMASAEIEAANTPRLDGILKSTNWNDESKLGSPATRNRIIRRLIVHFSELDLRDANLVDDSGSHLNVLGDAYEYLIERFADDAGKKGGEFYTPRRVVRLLVELLEPQERMRICDPTAGSADMLNWAADYVRQHGGNPVNLVLHGLGSAHLEDSDTITEPQLTDEQGRLLAYDRVLANPPFSLKEWGYESAAGDKYHRFDRWGIPPKTRGDLAFMEHMIATTNATGMAGVVMPHGVLFRGGAEAAIRSNIVKADLFEAIIGLAPNLFSGAGIPVAVCVLNRAKRPQRTGKILFIDAAQPGYFRPGKARNFLEPEHIKPIVKAFQAFADIPRFAHVADLAEVEGNDYNLNITRYVDTAVEEEHIDVQEALTRLRELERERDAAVAKMNEVLAELGFA